MAPKESKGAKAQDANPTPDDPNDSPDYETLDAGELYRQALADGVRFAKFVKLQPGEGLTGILDGFTDAEVTDPTTGEVKFVPIVQVHDPRTGNVASLLCTNQVEAGLKRATPGDTVTIIRSTEPDTMTRKGRRVAHYLVGVKPVNPAAMAATALRSTVRPSALPAPAQAPALPAPAQVDAPKA